MKFLVPAWPLTRIANHGVDTERVLRHVALCAVDPNEGLVLSVEIKIEYILIEVLGLFKPICHFVGLWQIGHKGNAVDDDLLSSLRFRLAVGKE